MRSAYATRIELLHVPGAYAEENRVDQSTNEESFVTTGNKSYVSDARSGLAKILSVEGISRVDDELDEFLDALGALPSRYPVIRSASTEHRASIDRFDRIYVYQRDNFHCTKCGCDSDLTLDHITPWSAGGTDHVDNLRTMCWRCNVSRSNFRHMDDEWRPLPLTFCCVDCDPQLALDHPAICPTFCWWCRHKALGSRSRWFEENPNG